MFVQIILALLVLVSAACFLLRKAKAAQTLQSMAQFPERNPEPVLCVSFDGHVRYANPAAKKLGKQGSGSAAVDSVLPPDLSDKIAKLLDSGYSHSQWEYPHSTGLLRCSLHCIGDLDVCHVYLKDVTAQHVAETLLDHNSMHNMLTGLPNRRALTKRLEEATSEGVPAAILLLELDRIQGLMVTLGHDTCDRLLQSVSMRLSSLEALIPGSTLHHFRENQLVLFCPNFSGTDKLEQLVEKSHELMTQAFYIDSRELYFSLIMGASRIPENGYAASTLLRCADAALQHAKRNDNNFQQYYPELDLQAVDNLELEHALAHAVERGELTLRYQPQFRVHDGRMAGVEVLVRWHHPTQGEIPPSKFIPLAESTGAIYAIDQWVLQTACKRHRTWQEAGLPQLVMAVNLSPRNLHLPDLVHRIESSLALSGMSAKWLVLEITESAEIQNIEHAKTTLAQLRDLGIKIALDDFGTGHSAFTWLRRFPIDQLKIDMSFTRSMQHEPADAMIVCALVRLGREMGLSVLAEGVEEADQLAMLRSMRCDKVQGYLFSRPLAEAQLLDLLTSQPLLDHSQSEIL
jgi:diguanylate cyclase (GGDEF)-like protein